ncbi:MAG: antibiotic biosynthesis monooxygenase [Alphaproteobacteria bacterium]
MSIWVTIEAKVGEGRYEELVPFLQKNLPNTRSFSGSLGVSLFYDQETRNFLISEEWLSREHHQNYIKFVTDNGALSQLASYLEGPPVIKYYSRLLV